MAYTLNSTFNEDHFYDQNEEEDCGGIIPDDVSNVSGYQGSRESREEDSRIARERQKLIEGVLALDLDALADMNNEFSLDSPGLPDVESQILNRSHLENSNYAVVVLVSEIPARSSEDAVALVRIALEKLVCKSKLDITSVASSYDSVFVKGGDIATMRRMRSSLPGFKTSWAHSFTADKSRICKIVLAAPLYVNQEFRRQIKRTLELVDVAMLSQKWNADTRQLQFSVKHSADLSKLDTNLWVEGQEIVINKPAVIIPQHPHQAILCFENTVSAQTMREVNKYLKQCCESEFTVWLKAVDNLVFFVVEDWKETTLLLDNFDFRPSLSSNSKWRGPYLAIEYNDFVEADHHFSLNPRADDSKVFSDLLDMKQSLHVMQQSIRRSIEFRLEKMFRPIKARLQDDTKQQTAQLDKLAGEVEAVRAEYDTKVVEKDKNMELIINRVKALEKSVKALSTQGPTVLPLNHAPGFGLGGTSAATFGSTSASNTFFGHA